MRSKLINEASIPDILDEMTLDEKVNLIILPGSCITYPVEDMVIPSLVLGDRATGVNGTHIKLDLL